MCAPHSTIVWRVAFPVIRLCGSPFSVCDGNKQVDFRQHCTGAEKGIYAIVKICSITFPFWEDNPIVSHRQLAAFVLFRLCGAFLFVSRCCIKNHRR